jgi:hypothetical protein
MVSTTKRRNPLLLINHRKGYVLIEERKKLAMRDPPDVPVMEQVGWTILYNRAQYCATTPKHQLLYQDVILFTFFKDRLSAQFKVLIFWNNTRSGAVVAFVVQVQSFARSFDQNTLSTRSD